MSNEKVLVTFMFLFKFWDPRLFYTHSIRYIWIIAMLAITHKKTCNMYSHEEKMGHLEDSGKKFPSSIRYN